MSTTIINHALKVCWVLVVLSLPHMRGLPHGASDLATCKALPTQFVPELLAAQQSVQHSVDGMFKWIPFNDDDAFFSIFRFVIKSTCVFFFSQTLICFLSRKHIMQWINAPASRERKLGFQFLIYVSTSICCIKTVGLISIRFTGIDQLHIPYTSTKVYANWMSASSWLLCLKTAITFACVDLPISVHNDRHLSANGFVTVRPIAMNTRLWRVKINVSRISPESSNFTPRNKRGYSNIILKTLRLVPLDLGA